MVFPLFSFLAAIVKAASKAAPEEMPISRPSFFAASLATGNAFSSLVRYISSMILVSKIEGINPAPIPCIPWAPDSLPERTADVSGSMATT